MAGCAVQENRASLCPALEVSCTRLHQNEDSLATELQRLQVPILEVSLHPFELHLILADVSGIHLACSAFVNIRVPSWASWGCRQM